METIEIIDGMRQRHVVQVKRDFGHGVVVHRVRGARPKDYKQWAVTLKSVGLAFCEFPTLKKAYQAAYLCSNWALDLGLEHIRSVEEFSEIVRQVKRDGIHPATQIMPQALRYIRDNDSGLTPEQFALASKLLPFCEE